MPDGKPVKKSYVIHRFLSFKRTLFFSFRGSGGAILNRL